MLDNQLSVIEEKQLIEVFSSENGLDGVVQEARNIVDGFEHDLSTAAGRKRTASIAAKVAKLKTKVDGLGKELVSEWKEKSKKVDASRKKMRDELDLLKVEARKPLTDWEDEQKKIEEEKKRLEEAEQLKIKIDQDHELAILMNSEFDRKAMDEAKRIEQERIDREAKIAKEAEEKAKREAEERIAQAEREKAIAEQAKIDAKKEAERLRVAAEEREKQNQIRAQQQKEEAERMAKLREEEARQKEIKRQEQERVRIENEEAARKADHEHRKSINRQAHSALVCDGNLEHDHALDVLKLIIAGKIPNVTINY